MPASRSRTEHWQDSLKKIQERGGALEISINQGHSGEQPADGGADVVWRCRLVAITPDHLVIEPPAAFGSPVHLDADVALIGAMTIGQNRWMFHTRTLGERPGQRASDRVLLLALPERVERCTRRAFFRISTANLNLPTVQCWPLLDPSTVAAAEAANRVEIENPSPLAAANEPALLPDVGPSFRANLLNISGGGLGLLVAPSDAPALSSRPFLWIRLDLRPHIPAPVALTARVAHTHVDSSQNLYAGLAFDFAHNPGHRRFIVDLFGAYLTSLQRAQRSADRLAA